MTVKELGDRMGSAELVEWSLFERIEGPVGPARADVQTAMLSSVVANASPNRRKGSRQAKPEDFMPKWDRGPTSPPPSESPEQERARVLSMLGGQPEPKELLGPDGKPVKR